MFHNPDKGWEVHSRGKARGLGEDWQSGAAAMAAPGWPKQIKGGNQFVYNAYHTCNSAPVEC